MQRLGIIDIGSNSVRLLLVDISFDGYFNVINEFKESVRLGDTFSNGILKEDRIERAIYTLQMFKTICESACAHKIICVATAAVRKAPNQDAFVQTVLDKTGIEVKILPGEKEAYFAYCGVIHSLDEKDGLIMDIGGGSTELVHFEDGNMKNAISLPFGSIDISKRFDTSQAVCAQTANDLKDFLLSQFNSVPWLKDIGKVPLIGVGGTIRNIGKIDKKYKNYPLDLAHNYSVDSKSVCNIYEMAMSVNMQDRTKIKGLSKDRADIFLGACGAVWHLMEYCSISDLVVSGSGIREGLVYDYIERHHFPVDDVLGFSIDNIIDRFNMNRPHAYQVYKLSSSMHSQLNGVLGIPDNAVNVLKASALLHDSGISISYYGHQHHSFYMILNSGIHGLSHREIVMSAFAASMHRNKKIKPAWKGYSDIISNEDMESVMKISLLLRLAESFDTCMDNFIEDVNCKFDSKKVTISLVARKKPNVEINRALYAADSFEKLTGRKLVIC